MKQYKQIIEYYKACTQITKLFKKTYFNNKTEDWWVGAEIGGALFINDYFFNMNDMVQYIKHKYPVNKMFEHYEYKLEIIESNLRRDKNKQLPVVNIQSYLQLQKEQDKTKLSLKDKLFKKMKDDGYMTCFYKDKKPHHCELCINNYKSRNK